MRKYVVLKYLHRIYGIQRPVFFAYGVLTNPTRGPHRVEYSHEDAQTVVDWLNGHDRPIQAVEVCFIRERR